LSPPAELGATAIVLLPVVAEPLKMLPAVMLSFAPAGPDALAAAASTATSDGLTVCGLKTSGENGWVGAVSWSAL
jgi:hypothetical protein